MGEFAREAIEAALKTGDGFSPEADQVDFDKLILNERIRLFHAATDDITFFDRGILDGMAFFRFFHRDIPPLFTQTAKQYRYDTVFYLPPWKKIYIRDNARQWHNFYEAKKLGQHHYDLYQEYGYTVITVPKGSTEERVNFILSHTINTSV